MSNGSIRSFSSVVELRMAETFDVVVGGETNSRGEFKLEEIQPGKYELWVLITTRPSMVSGCSEIRPPDINWKIGVNFDGDKGLTMENAYLSKALLLIESLQGSGLQAKGLYAVLSDFEIVSGIENKFDVPLFCD